MTRDTRPVVVLTNIEDPTADLVIDELHDRHVPVVRFDPGADFGELATAAHIGPGMWAGRLRTATRDVDLAGVRALYYRRPSQFAFPQLDPQDARFAAAAARYGLGGILASLPGCRYVNHPMRIADAEYKPLQLAAAVDLGFTVPRTLLTTVPDAARAFAREHGPVVHKPLWLTPWEDEQGRPCTIMVAPVTPDDLDDNITGTVHMFQAQVPKVADLRVTVVGHRVFAVRIDSADGRVDWRTDYSILTYKVVDTPPRLEAAMLAYCDRFGLNFGAFDFALTAHGDWVFLECNPSGQWAWLEPETGLSMTAAIADLLGRTS